MPVTSKQIAESFAMIDDFLIDCSLRENHSFDADVTDFPVESGANVTDNIRPLPIVIEIEGLISNTPIGLMRGERVDVTKTPVRSCYDLFQAIREERKPVTIRTSMGTYENMAMKSLSIPRGEHEDAMKFNATFQQIQMVTNVREIRASIPIAKNGTGTGKNKKTVTKPTPPYGGRIIHIHKPTRTWFDPDLGQWRHNAVFYKALDFSTTVRGERGTFSTTTKHYNAHWKLYRGLPRNDQLTTPLTGTFQLTPDGDLYGLPYKEVIAVPISSCELVGFTIKKQPGQALDFDRTDAAR